MRELNWMPCAIITSLIACFLISTNTSHQRANAFADAGAATDDKAVD
jgi:hypothetical protein